MLVKLLKNKSKRMPKTTMIRISNKKKYPKNYKLYHLIIKKYPLILRRRNDIADLLKYTFSY